MSNPDRIDARKLKGFRDYLPQQAVLRKKIQDRIYHNAFTAGFQAIDTPVLEYAETLLGTGSQDTDKEVYRFVDHGDRAVALRFDLTVPFARFVAENYAELTFPFKKVQIGNSWRGEKPQKGRYREFCQADLDIIGVDSISADVEVLGCITQNLIELVPRPFTMAIGHRVILSSLIQVCLPQLNKDGEMKAFVAIDKLAKVGEQTVLQLLLQIEAAEQAGAEQLLRLIQQKTAEGDTDLEPILSLFAQHEVGKQEIARLRETVALLRSLLPVGSAKFLIDLSIARGLGYYTGIVFETTIDGLNGFGSISSGGRYNGLVSRFSSQELPGIGGSIGVDRLLAALEQLEGIKAGARQGVFIAVAGAEARTYAFQLATELRRNEVIADLSLKEGKLAQQFRYADKRAYQFVLTVGSEELASRTVSLKNLETGEEEKAQPWDAALQKLCAFFDKP